MTQDMRTIMTRLFTVLMLMVFSMGAKADVKVLYGDKGTEKFEGTGGTIEVKQEDSKNDKTKVTITLIVTPADGYKMEKNGIEAYAVISTDGASTRAPEISGDALNLTCNDYTSDTKKRTYTVDIDSKLALWVKSATFEKKSGDAKLDPTSSDYSGVYYIRSLGKNQNNSNKFYLCPTQNWYYFLYDSPHYLQHSNTPESNDNGMPFLTTSNSQNASYDATEAVWIVEKQSNGSYHIKRAIDGKYLTYNVKMENCSKDGRMRVHLEESPTDEDAILWDIIYVSNKSCYDIISKKNDSYKYLNVNDGNKLDLIANGKTDGPNNMATGGIIGLWTSGSSSDDNGKWSFEEATVAPPTFTNNYTANNTFTITAESEATIYYTTDGTTPTTSTTTTGTTSVNVTQTEDMTVIKAIAKGENDAFPSLVATYDIPKCERPVITVSGGNVTITCATEGATIYYTTNGDPATPSSPLHSSTLPITFSKGDATTIKAIATKPGYVKSTEAQFLPPAEVSSSSEITNMSGNYILADNFSQTGSIGTSENPFTGTIDGNMVTRTLSYPLVAYAEDATIKNVILKDVTINGGTNVGAICNEARGDSRIYNCGVLGTLTETKDDNGIITNIASTSTITGSGYVGSIVGLLDGTSRVINCYSFAKVSGGSVNSGIVGYNNQSSTQDNLKTVVVNCMFYGDITGSGYPVYGGYSINNDANNGINPYCYFRKNATFTVIGYNRSWPAEEKNLTRFEYYRSVLNSNRKLCTWWVNGTNGTAPTDDDVYDVGIAKWVLDPSIAPYPILKPWGKYSSVINYDPDNRFDSETKTWMSRSTAEEWEGKSYDKLTVTVKAGSHNSGASDVTKYITITDMDLENGDYGYYKIQLPYYNEVFGNPNGATHAAKYGNNYTDQVVTGWEITATGSGNAFASSNFNFADRNSVDKDNYSTSGRVFAQGGYYYVPKGVDLTTGITITAHWGNAVYLANRGRSIDRVKVTFANYKEDQPFAPAGTIDNTFQTYTVYDDLQSAIQALGSTSTVYDQAIVLIGNHQVKNGSTAVDNTLGGWHPFTIMSADFDFDNEPDYCLELQFRNGIDRPAIQPVRFDFLPVIELGLAVRHDDNAYSIGIMVPQGHFEITETALMRTTQFEWDASVTRYETNSPVILNGGEFEQLAVRYVAGNRTSYFLLGGNLWFHRFAPGAHPNKGTDNKGNPRLCPISVNGGDFPEFYLSGLYRPDKTPPNDQGDPKCYIDGGHFGKIYGSGYDKINGSVTFKINHADIEEFYGGGINGSNPVGGNINVTIDNSRVTKKYCGGPEVGNMTGKTVTTNATGTTFEVFYGGGNGGNSYYRELQRDGDMDDTHIGDWTGDWKWDKFLPLETLDDDVDKENKGYHAEYEFEVFNQSNGVPKSGVPQITQRGFIKWIQFGITITGDVENTLTDCTINKNFYGGGNLATVDGTVTSKLTNTTVIGNVFGAGFSAEIPTFQVHDKSTVSFPYLTAGTITDGHIDYDNKVYEWTNDIADNAEGTTDEEKKEWMKKNPTYSKTEGGETKWYCYTWNSLENLGVVTGNVELNINGNTVVKGMTDIGEATEAQTGGVFGGGDASSVGGNTTVTINANGQKTGDGYTYNTFNVFGGGNDAAVGGNSSVILAGNTQVLGNVFGGGNKGIVSGSATVKIQDTVDD